jgi:ATP-binding cassette subfamily B protein
MGTFAGRRRLSAADRLLVGSLRRAGAWGPVYLAAQFGTVVAGLLIPAALAAAVDAVVSRHGTAPVVRFLLLLVAAALLAALDTVAGTMYATRVEASFRRELAATALRLPPAGRATFPPGDLASRLVASTQEAAGTALGAVGIATTVGSALFAVGALALLDWTLVVAVLVIAPATLLVARRLVHRTSDLFARYQSLQGRVAALLSDALAGIRTIRAAGTADREVDRVLAPVPELSRTGRELWRVQRGSVWQFSLLMTLAELIVMAVAGWGVARGRLSAGEFLAASAYSGMALGALGQIDAVMEIAYGRGSAARLVEVLDAGPVPAPADGALPPGPGEVVLAGVRVRVGDQVVLDGVDLVVPAGRVLAVVGASGTGKSTLAHLVGGLLTPESGSVCIDGCPVSTLSATARRQAVAYAFERPYLLGATIAEAIAYGSAAPSGPAVERAAAIAGADGFIRRLPDGFRTPLPEAPMSGGEVQRLGLTRALYANARILVVDDATASLDTLTERQVIDAITVALAGRTRVVVAHRAATAARADLVAWLDDGRIRAVDTHEALSADGDYRALFAGRPLMPGAYGADPGPTELAPDEEMRV